MRGYGKVADAFRANLDSGLEVGAACSVYRDSRKVVDLWGGVRNHETSAPWESDTLVNVFSTTKGVASLTVAVAASRGLLDYDAKVADYWPEFAQNGKEAVTVRQLLAHQAGLAAITPPLALSDLSDHAILSGQDRRTGTRMAAGRARPTTRSRSAGTRARLIPPRRPARPGRWAASSPGSRRR